MKKTLRWLFFAWFSLILLDSPIRYFLHNLDAIVLLYVKDILLLIIILYGIVKTIKSMRINKSTFVISGVILVSIFMGLINQLNFLQVLFGIKIFLPLLAGIVIGKYEILKPKHFVILYRISIPIIIIGLILEYFKLSPWSGFSYTFAGFIIEGNRYWTTFGIQRLSGFQRASFESGILLVFLDMFYLLGVTVVKNKEKINLRYYKLYDVLLFILSIIGIIYTTSKTAYLAIFSLIVIYILVIINLKSKDRMIQKLSLIAIKSVISILFAFAIIPPIISFINSNYINKINLSNSSYLIKWFFTSFIDRMENTWLDAFALVTHSYFKLLGRGMGGIGAPQQYFETYLYNPGDNIFVYLYVIFGYLVLGLIIWLIRQIVKIKIRGPNDISIIFFLLAFFSYGATLNALESPFFSICIGVLISNYYNKQNKNK